MRGFGNLTYKCNTIMNICKYVLMLRLDLLVKYLNQDLTLSDDRRKALIETTKDLRKKIEYGYE